MERYGFIRDGQKTKRPRSSGRLSGLRSCVLSSARTTGKIAGLNPLDQTARRPADGFSIAISANSTGYLRRMSGYTRHCRYPGCTVRVTDNIRKCSTHYKTYPATQYDYTDYPEVINVKDPYKIKLEVDGTQYKAVWYDTAGHKHWTISLSRYMAKSDAKKRIKEQKVRRGEAG